MPEPVQTFFETSPIFVGRIKKMVAVIEDHLAELVTFGDDNARSPQRANILHDVTE